jgi:hypothetical protein
MALADTEKTVNAIRDAPSVLVLHSLTNDLKESAPTCMSPMKNIIVAEGYGVIFHVIIL